MLARILPIYDETVTPAYRLLHAGLRPKHTGAPYVLFSLFRLPDGPQENSFFQITPYPLGLHTH